MFGIGYTAVRARFSILCQRLQRFVNTTCNRIILVKAVIGTEVLRTSVPKLRSAPQGSEPSRRGISQPSGLLFR